MHTAAAVLALTAGAMLTLATAARADDPATDDLPTGAAPAPLQAQLPWEESIAESVFFDAGFQKDSTSAPALELAQGLDVQVEQKRRRFRARAVDWMSERSPGLGRFTDFMLGGAESGLHMDIDPTGQDEYMLEWKIRFR